jgi:hypothetical protein
MPWLKGNVKFWTQALIKRPQYVTGPAHAIRNTNLSQNDPREKSPYPPSDFSLDVHGTPYEPPFVGRVASDVANMAGSLAKGDALGAGEAVWHGLSGRQTPLMRTATDAFTTMVEGFSGDVKGPEDSYNMIVNPKAPKDVQREELAKYAVGHYMPIPLFQYAVQDAIRKGLSRNDLAKGIVGLSGGGYVGDEPLTQAQKTQQAAAQRVYKHAYDLYTYGNHNDKTLSTAWDTYMRRLQQIGIINK